MPYAPCPLTPPSPCGERERVRGKEKWKLRQTPPKVPSGAEESGEGTQLAPALAIINAIYDVIGVRFSNLPVTLQKVLEALHGKKN
jgi:hypothetical protein